jgi:hypothetical protein
MSTVDSIVADLISSFRQQGYAQVSGYNRFGFVRGGDTYVIVSRENGKDTKPPIAEWPKRLRRCVTTQRFTLHCCLILR